MARVQTEQTRCVRDVDADADDGRAARRELRLHARCQSRHIEPACPRSTIPVVSKIYCHSLLHMLHTYVLRAMHTSGLMLFGTFPDFPGDGMRRRPWDERLGMNA